MRCIWPGAYELATDTHSYQDPDRYSIWYISDVIVEERVLHLATVVGGASFFPLACYKGSKVAGLLGACGSENRE